MEPPEERLPPASREFEAFLASAFTAGNEAGHLLQQHELEELLDGRMTPLFLEGRASPAPSGLMLQSLPHLVGDAEGAAPATLPAPAARREAGRRAAAEDKREARATHGACEKQRRDRINAKIEELRLLLVPATASAEDKANPRSKLEVLQCACDRITELEARLSSLTAHAPAEAAAAAPPRDSLEALLLPEPSGGGGNAGVEVQLGAKDDTCFVRVRCPDRRGLLSDLMSALKTLSLEVVATTIINSSRR